MEKGSTRTKDLASDGLNNYHAGYVVHSIGQPEIQSAEIKGWHRHDQIQRSTFRDNLHSLCIAMASKGSGWLLDWRTTGGG